jgi:hypothetical protein
MKRFARRLFTDDNQASSTETKEAGCNEGVLRNPQPLAR